MISHTTIKVDGKDNTYDIKFSGASLGSAARGKVDVKTGDKTKSVTGFVFTPSADFAKVGAQSGATMKDLKEAVAKAVTAAGIEAPKKADPLPATPKGDAPAAKTEPALVGGTDGDIDL